MFLLALDTAGPDCAVALARSGAGGGEIVARASEKIGRGHAERLMPMIEALLAETGVDFTDLDRLAVTVGPGSFTGVRVGIAAARGLALALDIPAVGVNSLEALALPVARRKSAGSVVAALDAKRGEIYAFARDLASGGILIEATALRVEDIPQRLRLAPRPLFVTGSGASILADALDNRDVVIIGMTESPAIEDVAALGLGAEDGAAPAPLYLRGADAKPQGDKAVALQ
jgi:tRNA threonylcarbamoyladenosine biosynthesis protein TsaB